MEHDALDGAEARYELVIYVDARGSSGYDDVAKPEMRQRIYRVLNGAFRDARVASDSLHMEDRGDGVLVSVAGRVAVTRLLGLWMVEVHERLRAENRALRVPLGLRVGMHVGPVRHDSWGISGQAVDLACGLANSAVARRLLDAEAADLVLGVSRSLYDDVVSHGGKFIEPTGYARARLELKGSEVTAWFHLPGRPAPRIPGAGDGPAGASGPEGEGGAPGTGRPEGVSGAEGEARPKGVGGPRTAGGAEGSGGHGRGGAPAAGEAGTRGPGARRSGAGETGDEGLDDKGFDDDFDDDFGDEDFGDDGPGDRGEGAAPGVYQAGRDQYNITNGDVAQVHNSRVGRLRIGRDTGARRPGRD
ncbi:hypothetical protein NX801_06545 [Streptomyces sp. LP05-1]|uniref:Guanylate cyclase domain-containing protein n=1 Tax=Streptomyces pyxinae TaxID=2970734 RepID=A0ABT2CD39_9ACTN|nr:hypothetical protein [Streptomyces sp. LP05-1]MCS0635320.1 hypothetical protein [Streptomyces sp. LP05-1]